MDILLILFLIALNGIFAMSELALASSKRVRLQKLADEGDPGSQAALRLMDAPTHFLSSIQVGITSIGVLNGIVGEAAFSGALATWLIATFSLEFDTAEVLATALVVAGITFVTIVFGELVPKRVGQLYPEQVSRLIAIPMTWLAKLARPFVWLLAETTQATLKLLSVNNNAQQSVTEEEIEASLAEGVGSGLIESQEHQMVRNVFALDSRSLESIMVPRADIEWLEAGETVRQAMISAQLRNHSWFPVCKESLDEVMGVIRLADLLDLMVTAPDEPIGHHVMPPTYLPETLNGLELLEQYRESPIRMALVVDEYGVVQGLLTPRDVLEAITGEIKSEESVDDWALRLGENEWDLNGLMPANELKARLEIDELPDEAEGTYHTLAGLMLAVSGRLMHTGDAIELQGWRFEVVALEGRRIDRVKATLLHKRSDTQD